MARDTFCVLPWVHAATLTDGSVQLCCVSGGGSGINLNEQTLGDYWQSEYVRDARRRMLAGEPVKARTAPWTRRFSSSICAWATRATCSASCASRGSRAAGCRSRASWPRWPRTRSSSRNGTTGPASIRAGPLHAQHRRDRRGGRPRPPPVGLGADRRQRTALSRRGREYVHHDPLRRPRAQRVPAARPVRLGRRERPGRPRDESHRMPALVEYTARLDSLRGSDVLDVFPELAPAWSRYEVAA